MQGRNLQMEAGSSPETSGTSSRTITSGKTVMLMFMVGILLFVMISQMGPATQ
jgi:hypothetical protein